MSHKRNQTMKQPKIKINYKLSLKNKFYIFIFENMKFYFTLQLILQTKKGSPFENIFAHINIHFIR